MNAQGWMLVAVTVGVVGVAACGDVPADRVGAGPTLTSTTGPGGSGGVPTCGDGTCDEGEDAASCPQDGCGCGNGVCDWGEGATSCEAECFCGNGTCDADEHQGTCAAECGAVAITTSFFASCVVIGDGTARCWGHTVFGLLGPGDDERRPVKVRGLASTVSMSAAATSSVGAGGAHACALLADSTAVCWGGYVRDCGIATCGEVFSDVPIAVDGLDDVVQLSGGGLGTLAVKSDGTIWHLGWDGPPASQVAAVEDAVSVSAGRFHACAVLADGTYQCWSEGTAAQLLGSPLTDVQAIAVGEAHACALVDEGSVWCWGTNTFGQLGPEAASASVLAEVTGVPSTIAVSAGDYHSCALGSDGTVWCWGDNYEGQLGDGASHEDCGGRDCSRTPVQVAGLEGATAIVATHLRTCALTSDGRAWCWGQRYLGDGSSSDSNVPVEVAPW